jgi:hypothetical protein
MPVVTIARETGAGGAEVGRLLANRLAADLVNGYLIDEVARRLELPREDVEARDEQPRSILERLLRGLALAQGQMGADVSRHRCPARPARRHRGPHGPGDP